MSDGRLAFCSLLFAANGGRFNDHNKPILDGTRGTCDEPFDCGDCPFMKSWIANLSTQGWFATWACTDCVKSLSREEKYRKWKGLDRLIYVPGYFTSASRPENNTESYRITRTECELCHDWSDTSFLQLVLRRRGDGQ